MHGIEKDAFAKLEAQYNEACVRMKITSAAKQIIDSITTKH